MPTHPFAFSPDLLTFPAPCWYNAQHGSPPCHIPTPLPLLAGTMLYLLWRPDSLLVFQWIATVGLTDPVAVARAMMEAWPVPPWVLYALPGGLWVFAGTTAVAAVWWGAWHAEARIWGLLPTLLGCLHELGQ